MTDAFPTFTRSLGQGPLPALMLHCALAHSGAFRGLAGALDDVITATALDMPGHGRSGPWDGQADVHDLVTAQALACLDRPRHLIGHSFGATVALRLALEAPDRVLSLTLIEPVLFAAAPPDLLEAHRRAAAPFAEALEAGDLPTAAQRFVGDWGTGQPWEALTEAQRAAFTAIIPMIGQTDACLSADSKGLLAPGRPEAIRCPVLLIRGAASPPIIAAIHGGLLARIPGARDVAIPGAGHMVPITHPGETATAIRAHLEAVSPALRSTEDSGR